MSDILNSGVKKQILFCNCGGERIPKDLLGSVDQLIRSSGAEVTILSDLCGLIAAKKHLLTDLFIKDAECLVIGCYRRTMDLLFKQIDELSLTPEDYNHINLFQAKSEEEVFEQLNGFCTGSIGSAQYREIIEDSGWPAWYPVMDYSRCTACGQCAEFCLFGVYEKTDDRVNVVNPSSCKNNCPACARICPVTAIIFPKYKNGGAIGGSDEIDEQAELQRQALDIESFLGSDMYFALEKRKAKRQSIIRQEAMNKAILERDKALDEINKKEKN
jgi:NAD-dependent dihydropyrimidine dehydrogenase PreA subunit